MLKILFILDPFKKLHTDWDNSLIFARELSKRGHHCYVCEITDIFASDNTVKSKALRIRHTRTDAFRLLEAKTFSLPSFDLIVFRKEPPFDQSYLYTTYLLDLIATEVPIVNHPTGIRSVNEKTACFFFPEWSPKSIITSSIQEILKFQKNLKKAIVVKPLNEKGGTGIFLLPLKSADAIKLLSLATHKQTIQIVAQEQLTGPQLKGDKRIFILNGEILAAYEKHFPKNDFRSNISRGATYHPATITSQEKKLVSTLKPFLLRRGLYLTGIDVMLDKLIEINVTCPAGPGEAQELYPGQPIVAKCVDFLERFARSFHSDHNVRR